ncbi:MAG: BMP family ABC transporter substrate-binding protein [Treponema sp.]
MKSKITFLLVFVLAIFFVSCAKEEKKDDTMNIAVFLPGVRAESPIYDMLATGVEKAVENAKNNGKNVELLLLEAGTNQGQWVEKLSNIAAENKYDVIISSNPSMPSIAKQVLEKFPNNKFLLLDAYCADEPKITTFKYNQYEQAYIAGYIAALVSASDMKNANKEAKIGLIAGQEYPDMNNIILPSFLAGAKSVDEKMEVDFRIVGNWYDASKGAELASSMYNDGVDVIMPICGGANQGVITSAKENNFYLVWCDSNGYARAEGLVVGSAMIEQETLAYEKTTEFINKTLVEGKAEILGMKEGYIKFITDDPLYISTVPQAIREKQDEMLNKIKNNQLDVETLVKTK